MIPFIPNIAITLIPLNYPRKHELLIIDKTEDIVLINIQIIGNEYIYNGDFVISNDKKELDKLRCLLMS